jgi:UDP-N-acetylmuramoyl-tripeptide--D-alanyl-D-alanine ligase
VAEGWSGFELGWIAEVCGGRVAGDGATRVDRIARDSREDVRGALYVALRGETHDGHAFLADAARAGAAAALVEEGRFREADLRGMAAVVVADAVAAIGALARAHRRRMPARVVGLTGSCGKTATKDLLAAVLSRVGPTCATAGNLNNHIGVPFTLFDLRPEHRFAVVEMGCNHRGEIANLASIAEPDAGLITCVAPAHLEGLGSLEGVARAKGELFLALDRPGAVAVVNADDPLVAALPTGRARRLTAGESAGADVRFEVLRLTEKGPRLRLLFPDAHAVDADVPLPGRHQAANAALAAAAAWAVGASLAAVAEGLALVAPGEHRGQILSSPRGVRILDDTYNANPASVRRALETLETVAGTGRKVAILGEMLELGEAAPDQHGAVGEAAGRAGLGLLACVGPSARHVAEGAKAAGMSDEAVLVFVEFEALLESLDGLLRPGDRVLVKGSRGMRMERVVERILGGAADAV